MSEPAKTRNVIKEIEAERRRQISEEGYDDDHDDKHYEGQLARAAYCYTRHAATDTLHKFALQMVTEGSCPPMWPWHVRHWKPKDRRSDLIKAAALIAAEVERLDRLEAKNAE